MLDEATRLIELLKTGGPYAVTALSCLWSFVLYRDLRARDAQIFDLLSKQLRLLGDGKEER